jgi:hypothetical protein
MSKTLALKLIGGLAVIGICAWQLSKSFHAPATVGSAAGPSRDHKVRIEFEPPANLANAVSKTPRGAIFQGWFTGTSWGDLCETGICSSSGYSCELALAPGSDLTGNVQMTTTSGVGGCTFAYVTTLSGLSMRFWGDRSNSSCGGHGQVQGTLRIFVDGTLRPYDLRNNTDDQPCAGDYCNFHVRI